MNQTTTGIYIAQKRKEKNLTQGQLAERLGISNKTISKWENGRNMPDYGILPLLCKELDVSLSELLDGHDRGQCNAALRDNPLVLDLFSRVQKLEKQKKVVLGILIISFFLTLFSLSHFDAGNSFQEFLSGFMKGASIPGLLIGIIVLIKPDSHSKN